MRPLGDGFIKLVKMLIAPIVFSTVVVGIAHMGAMKEVGRIGMRALVYFEVVSTLALVIGLVVVNVVQPGSGLTIDAARRWTCRRSPRYTTASKKLTTTDFLLNVIPNTVVDAFARGEILQVLLFSVLFGLALLALGPSASQPLVALIDQLSHALFAHRRDGDAAGADRRLRRDGVHRRPLRRRHAALARPADGRRLPDLLLFVFVVLGGIARLAGFSLLKFLRYISEEILIVARHVVVRVGAAADHGEARAPRLPRSRSSAW